MSRKVREVIAASANLIFLSTDDQPASTRRSYGIPKVALEDSRIGEDVCFHQSKDLPFLEQYRP